ncbi:MAG: beta galactosidase jelly roll domain-containing protein [Acidobacteriota bacterium]|nr:beta galactosidase jelly roll domain-containing protein [Acidobacteriota bacterium]
MRLGHVVALFLVATSLAAGAAGPNPGTRRIERIDLARGWRLESSAKIKRTGAEISRVGFPATGWHGATVPTTIVAALVADRTFPDPYFGMNMRSLPGVTYPIGNNFSLLPMSPDSPFAVSWWYRTEFTAPADFAGQQTLLHLDGISFRANVWLNGKQIATSEDIAGTWRLFEIDTRSALRRGRNALAIEVVAPTPHDLAMTFVDWNPMPPDKNMGLWRPVYLTAGGPVSLRHPFVETEVELPSRASARLTVRAELTNHSDKPVRGTLRGTIGTIGAIHFAQPVELAAGETRDVAVSPDAVPQLTMKDPKLWWPAQMGKPVLHTLRLAFETGGRVSDAGEIHFGIRQVTSEMDADKKTLLFRINGKPILIRGGGWAPDAMVREDPRKLEQKVRLAQHMGLNTIRLEGTLETEDFFQLTDRIGMLVMAGWCCCHHFEEWEKWDDQDRRIAERSQHDQILRLRAHPSVFVWLNSSDMPAKVPAVEEMYIRVLKQVHWPNPYVSSASATPSPFSGPSGVKMNGPYDFVPPVYWLDDPGKYGGAWSFATEISPGGAPPEIESVRAMLPKDHLWPVDDWWNFHAGGGEFKNMNLFINAMNARYGPSDDAEEFTTKSQMMAYEGLRSMYEAYSRNKYKATGVIQWMMTNAWPSMIWHQYDYYLRPGGGYYGTKKACEPLHAMYSYNDGSVWLISSRYDDAPALKVTATIYDLDMKQRWQQQATLDAPADSTQKVLTVPAVGELTGLSSTYFLVLNVDEPTGKHASSNLYWLSTAPEKVAWEKSTWWYSPTSSFADFTALNKLPKARVSYRTASDLQAGKMRTRVTVKNDSPAIAFFVRLKVNQGANGAEVLPSYWDDNYFSLLPGEEREITSTYDAAALGKAKPHVTVTGWNVEAR